MFEEQTGRTVHRQREDPTGKRTPPEKPKNVQIEPTMKSLKKIFEWEQV